MNSLHNKAQYYPISVRVTRVIHQDISILLLRITQSLMILDILVKNCLKLPLLAVERHFLSLIMYLLGDRRERRSIGAISSHVSVETSNIGSACLQYSPIKSFIRGKVHSKRSTVNADYTVHKKRFKKSNRRLDRGIKSEHETYTRECISAV